MQTEGKNRVHPSEQEVATGGKQPSFVQLALPVLHCKSGIPVGRQSQTGPFPLISGLSQRKVNKNTVGRDREMDEQNKINKRARFHLVLLQTQM